MSFFLKTIPLLVGVLVSAAFPLGDSLNFESGAYVVGNPVVDSQGRSVDGWERFIPPGTPVVIGQQPTILVQQSRRIAGGGKVLDCHGDASTANGVMRSFNPPEGGHLVDVRWSWNAESDTVDMCFGLASVPPGAAGASPVPKATVCMAPGGTLLAARGPALPTQDWASVTGKWQPNTTYHTLIRADMSKGGGVYSVFTSANPQNLEDTANRINTLPLPMQTSDGNRINRFFINASHRPYPIVDYGVEVDRISWFAGSFNVWTGAAGPLQYSWHNDSNWSLGRVPDSNHFAIFDTVSRKRCILNEDATPKARVLALLVTKAHTTVLNGYIELRDTLATLLGAELSGGLWGGAGPNGVLRFAYPISQILVDTGTGRPLPPIHQAGPGLLTLATYPGSTITMQSYTQTGGGLNLYNLGGNYAIDLTINGDLNVSGTPSSPMGVNGLYGMGGRTITVAGRTQFIGADTLNRLVVTSPLSWVLRAGGPVNARNAVIQNSILLSTASPPAPGEAISSVDSGGNSGWIFWNTPVAVSQPVDANVMVGARAVFRVVTADSALYQWQERNGSGSFVDLPGETSDSLVITGMTLEANNSVFRCRVWNPAGTIASNAATLRVRFPAPTANPTSTPFGGSLNVALDDSVSGASLFYSVNTGNFQPYTRGNQLVLTATTTIRSYAVLGPDTSATATFNYYLTQLAPNTTVALTNGYSLRNPSSTLSAQFTILPPDSAANPGFEVRFALRLQPVGTASFPSLEVLGPAADSLSLYFISNNNVYYRGNIDASTGATAEGPGKYFVGADTQAPIIYLPNTEVVQSDDTTRATFSIQDNVVNLKLDITRSDIGMRTGVDHTSPNAATFKLKNRSGFFQALTICISVSDGRNATQFPAPPAKSYALAQKLDEADGPPVWSVGTDPDHPWDLVGLPFVAEPLLTLKDLRDLNNLPNLAVQCCYTGGDPAYRVLSGDDTLPPGQALWMANDTLKAFLKFPAFKTAAIGDQSLEADLKTGWNALGSRRMDTLFWPTTRRNPNYFLDTVNILRALWAYDAVADAYAAADTLLPWRGYWVYNRGSNITVSLLTSPPPASKATASAPTLGLSLLSSRGVPLYLGAEKTFSDAFGREDEPMLPAPSRGPWATLLRGRRALMTDQVAFRPGLPMEWRLILSSTAGSSRGPATLQSGPSMWNLPEGYEVWAVSEQRGLRFELKPGGAPIQSPVGFTDTLRVFAAPSDWIASTLGSLPTRVDALAHNLVLRADRLELELQWPGEGPMRAEVFDPSGRKLASVSRNLPAGFYRLPLALPRGRGLLFVRVTGRAGAQNAAWTGRLAKP